MRFIRYTFNKLNAPRASGKPKWRNGRSFRRWNFYDARFTGPVHEKTDATRESNVIIIFCRGSTSGDGFGITTSVDDAWRRIVIATPLRAGRLGQETRACSYAERRERQPDGFSISPARTSTCYRAGPESANGCLREQYRPRRERGKNRRDVTTMSAASTRVFKYFVIGSERFRFFASESAPAADTAPPHD